ERSGAAFRKRARPGERCRARRGVDEILPLPPVPARGGKDGRGRSEHIGVARMVLKVLILGVNGFIGSSLTERILRDTDWEVYGMDMGTNKLDGCLENERFHFVEGDITINRE